MALDKPPPRIIALLGIDHFRCGRAGEDGRGLTHLPRRPAYRDRDPVIMTDIREFLARSKNQEIERQAVVDVTHDRRLRPAIGTQGRNGHGPMSVENWAGVVFHGMAPAFLVEFVGGHDAGVCEHHAYRITRRGDIRGIYG